MGLSRPKACTIYTPHASLEFHGYAHDGVIPNFELEYFHKLLLTPSATPVAAPDGFDIGTLSGQGQPF